MDLLNNMGWWTCFVTSRRDFSWLLIVPPRYSERNKPPEIHMQLMTKGFSLTLVAWASALGFSARHCIRSPRAYVCFFFYKTNYDIHLSHVLFLDKFVLHVTHLNINRCFQWGTSAMIIQKSSVNLWNVSNISSCILTEFVAAAVRSHFDDCPDSHRHFCFHGTCRFLILEEAPACVWVLAVYHENAKCCCSL